MAGCIPLLTRTPKGRRWKEWDLPPPHPARATPCGGWTLTEHGHELLGVEVPVAPVGPVAMQCGVFFVVVCRFGPKGVDDPNAAPAPTPPPGTRVTNLPVSPWAGVAPAMGSGTQRWLVRVVQCVVRAWAQTLAGCVNTGKCLNLSGSAFPSVKGG